MFKKYLKPLIPTSLLETRKIKLQKKQLLEWHYNDCPVPPPNSVKQIAIAYYQKKYAISTLVETGTYLGDMVEAQKRRFKNIVSIELSNALFDKANERFKNEKNICIMFGDSGKVLIDVMSKLNEPAIFWLDGHFSEGITAQGEKECPIFEELNAILNAPQLRHVLLIDDARLFVGKNDYPTIEELTKYIRDKNEEYQLEVKNDIIRYVI